MKPEVHPFLLANHLDQGGQRNFGAGRLPSDQLVRSFEVYGPGLSLVLAPLGQQGLDVPVLDVPVVPIAYGAFRDPDPAGVRNLIVLPCNLPDALPHSPFRKTGIQKRKDHTEPKQSDFFFFPVCHRVFSYADRLENLRRRVKSQSVVGRCPVPVPAGGICTFLYLGQVHRGCHCLGITLGQSLLRIREIRDDPHAASELQVPDPLEPDWNPESARECPAFDLMSEHIQNHLQRVYFQDMQYLGKKRKCQVTVPAAFAVYPDSETAPLTVLGKTASPTVPVHVSAAHRTHMVTKNATFRMFFFKKCLQFIAV